MKTLQTARVLGFTGTQRGVTWQQRKTLLACLELPNVEVLHHGDCIGADALAWSLARELHLETICHPCNLSAKRAYTSPNEETRKVLSPLVRNQNIVHECEFLIACPRTPTEELRSGTWATIRYAMRAGRPYLIIWPDGQTSEGEKDGNGR